MKPGSTVTAVYTDATSIASYLSNLSAQLKFNEMISAISSPLLDRDCTKGRIVETYLDGLLNTYGKRIEEWSGGSNSNYRRD